MAVVYYLFYFDKSPFAYLQCHTLAEFSGHVWVCDGVANVFAFQRPFFSFVHSALLAPHL